jgi:hypothetical protein
MAWVRKRTIPTERRQLDGEVSADRGVSRSQRGGSPTAVISEPLLFLSSSSSIVLMRLIGPRSKPAISQKMWQRPESNPDLFICSQELWPLDQKSDPCS